MEHVALEVVHRLLARPREEHEVAQFGEGEEAEEPIEHIPREEGEELTMLGRKRSHVERWFDKLPPVDKRALNLICDVLVNTGVGEPLPGLTPTSFKLPLLQGAIITGEHVNQLMTAVQDFTMDGEGFTFYFDMTPELEAKQRTSRYRADTREFISLKLKPHTVLAPPEVLERLSAITCHLYKSIDVGDTCGEVMRGLGGFGIVANCKELMGSELVRLLTVCSQVRIGPHQEELRVSVDI